MAFSQIMRSTGGKATIPHSENEARFTSECVKKSGRKGEGRRGFKNTR